MPDRICLSEDAIPQGSFNAPNDPLDRAAIKARLIAEGALPQDVIDRLG